MQQPPIHRTRAQESRSAIQRLYIAMRHLFIRGSYKPLGISGEAMIDALMDLRPEIYGSIADPERVELEGLLYVMQRLPQGIEECRYIKLISKEGFEQSKFDPLVPSKRRRNCYRIDEEQMLIEMTRGRSDIYDILTHLTFLYIEAEKIRRNGLDSKDRKRRDWLMLEEFAQMEESGKVFNQEVALTYLSTMLGRTYEETTQAWERFAKGDKVNSLLSITYWLGHRSMEEEVEKNDREITFSSSLREKVGHHIYGELWAERIKRFIHENNWLGRPIHIISANLHSVMNCFFASAAFKGKKKLGLEEMARELSLPENSDKRKAVHQYALKNGMTQLDDTSGTNISVQIFDTLKIDPDKLFPEIKLTLPKSKKEAPILIVMDYAFGEQAFETLDELLKPYEIGEEKTPLRIESISIMGKAGILCGRKGDIMIPTAHVFEGTADNYPFENDLSFEDFQVPGLSAYKGPMITVLGTSLQNKDVLRYFLRSSWRAIGLEMEGAHYQKAIQAASKIRRSVGEKIKLRYAYYASDNPLESGHTLASGSLGEDGVKSTYLITVNILKGILS